MKIKIKLDHKLKPSSKIAKLVLLVLAYYSFSCIFVYTFHLTRILLYLGDIFNLLIFLFAIRVRKIQGKGIYKIELLMLLFIFAGVLSSIINKENIVLIIWGLRNNIRNYIFFFSCVTFLKKQDVKLVLHVLAILFWLSIPLCTIERFFISYPQGTILGDMVGGLYWNYSGCNTPLNVILCVYMLITSIRFFYGEDKLSKFILVLVASLYMSATAELKVYLVELLIILIGSAVSSIKNGLNAKKILKFVSCAIVLSLVMSITLTYFILINDNGHNYSDNFSLTGLLAYASNDSGYTSIGDVNRLTGIATISKRIFNGNLSYILFGIGMGNAEYTNFFVSDFYKVYGGLNYQWFHDIWMFIEMGAVGIFLYLAVFFEAWKKTSLYLKAKNEGSFVKISIIIMLVFFIYNITLRTETTGPFLFLILSLPFILYKDMGKIVSQ